MFSKQELDWQIEADARNERRDFLLSTWREGHLDQDWPPLGICGAYNCTPEHPCLDCLDCPDCKRGTAYHSSRHGTIIVEPKARKTRVVLSESQKQDILDLSNSGATPRDLAVQFNVAKDSIYRLLATFKKH